MNVENIIFDVDGTLWDTTEALAQAWNSAIEEGGKYAPNLTANQLKQQFGKTMIEITNNLFGKMDPKYQEELMEACSRQELDMLKKSEISFLYPKVRETIMELSKYCRIFIVSNCQCGYIELFLEKNRLSSYITDIECYGNTGRPKGENIRRLLHRNQLKNAVYIGDTQGDWNAAKEAGISFIYASYGFGNIAEAPVSIKGMDDLLFLIQEKELNRM